jgi:uncharacterized membrane protein
MASGILKYKVDYIKCVLQYYLGGVCEIGTAILPDIHVLCAVLGSLRTIIMKVAEVFFFKYSNVCVSLKY